MDINVAVIDLGSNSIRMTISAITPEGKHGTIAYYREYVRLSEGMSHDNVLKNNAMMRTVEALENFVRLATDAECKTIVAIATAAVRSAINQQEFIDLVKERVHIEFEIIDGELEAYYDYLGVTAHSNMRDMLIFDVGGGSVEFVLVKNRQIVHSISLPYGAVVLSERFRGFAHSSLYRFASLQIGTIEWLDEAYGLELVGIGGTVRALVRAIKSIQNEETLNTTNFSLPSSKISTFYNMLAHTPIEERAKIDGVPLERADIILGGLTPIKAVMDILAAPRLVASSAGVREGVLERLKRDMLRKNLSSGCCQ